MNERHARELVADLRVGELPMDCETLVGLGHRQRLMVLPPPTTRPANGWSCRGCSASRNCPRRAKLSRPELRAP